MKRGIEDALSFVTGLGVGSMLTYLLDPDMGRKRRRTVARTTTGVVRGASESTTAAVGRATGAASDAAYRAGHAAGMAVGAAKHSAKDYGVAARRYGASAVDAGEDWLDSARHRLLDGLSSAGHGLSSAGHAGTGALRAASRATGKTAQVGTRLAADAVAAGGLFGSLSALFSDHDSSPRRAIDAAGRKAALAERRALAAAPGRARAQVAPARSALRAFSRRDAGPWYAPWTGVAAASGGSDGSGHQRLFDRREGPPEATRARRISSPAAVRSDSADHDLNFGDVMIGFGLVGVGAGLAYLLDTQRGRSRRAALIGRAGKLARTAAHEVAGSATHLSNRAKGVAADLSSAARAATGNGDTADDATIEARVRAEAGHVVDDVAALDLTVVDGRVTLSGHAPADRTDSLVQRLESVAGVRSVDNRLRAPSAA